ncbi:beta subunit of N-acylethanolamine-hydrolyzing acid amidase-domain-containing protein [Penicillium atrosanguineum]|uniref:beta subunit of N-acylethanolamine-hydrolyzing acid amidase-domain-containing protein n=1 Tax=Penicillium atrosanguineum TaxID=1132637 RepID=UPI0023A225C8|nr:beta subunit of N-acylethanolamine-hydrolyzing acid amidase-domain-containing protein [Penicillium atrosanguineum]KAJ5304201.1 beta subunit of N-acylethanolamine-hydrolyzing acid amidase-domain-containing protein [Penicillium atrosanguineum]
MSSRRPSQAHKEFLHDSTDSQGAISQQGGPGFSLPISGIQGATPIFPSDGDSHLTLRPTKRAATAPASPRRSPKRTSPEKSPSAQSAPAQLASAFHLNEFDFAITDATTLKTTKSTTDATAIANFLTAMEKRLAIPPGQRRTPHQSLQSFLIQQQLVAGIPVDKLEPMSGPGSRQSQGIPRLFNTPTALTYFNDATYIPAIPPAQFNGPVTPLPINPSLPNPPWMDQAKDDSNQSDDCPATFTQDSVTSTGSPMVNNPQTPEHTTELSAYFCSDAEQVEISHFYTTHFVTGSGILGQPPAASVLETTTATLVYESEDGSILSLGKSIGKTEKEAR